MTLLDERPTAEMSAPVGREPTRSSAASWRFAARLARREVRRRPGRTALAASLIAAPVFAMVVGSVLVRTESNDWAEQFERRYGTADIAIDPQFSFIAPIDAAFGGDDGSTGDVFDVVSSGDVELPDGTRRTEFIWVYSQATPTDPVDEPGGIWGVFTDLDLQDPVVGSRIEVLDGRPPSAGEMLLSSRNADLLGVDVGDTVTLDRPSGSWTVSGVGRMRDAYEDELFVIPGLAGDRFADDWYQTVTVLDLPAGTPATETQRLAAELGGVTAFADPYAGFNGDTRSAIGWGWVGGVLALVVVGIIVAAAFATSARRQLVTIGQLVANGAAEHVVRRSLALQGTWTAAVGAVAGIVAGLVAVPLLSPLVEWVLRHDLGALRIAPLDLVVIAVTAVVAGSVAALVPARTIARTPVMAALAGRRPSGRPPRWLVPTGLALVAGGLGLVALGALGSRSSQYGENADVWALTVTLGAVAVVVGMCCSTPLVVETVGGIGRRASLSWRLALRRLGRARSRSSALFAAIAVAVGGSVAAAAVVDTALLSITASTAVLPDDTVVFERWVDQSYEEVDGVIDLVPRTAAELSPAMRAEILEIVPGADLRPLRLATFDPAPFDPSTTVFGYPDPSGLRIADDAWLDVAGLSAADEDTLAEQGALWVRDRWATGADWSEPTTSRYAATGGEIFVEATYSSEPAAYDFGQWSSPSGGPVVTEAFAREAGFDIVTVGAIVRAGAPLTEAQRRSLGNVGVDEAANIYDAFVEPGDAPRPSPDDGVSYESWQVQMDNPEWRTVDGADRNIGRLVTTGAAVLVSLLIVAIGLALAAAESRQERSVLVAVGAEPASLRRQAAATAAVLALVGIMLGVPTGLAPTWVVYRITNDGRFDGPETLTVPWIVIGVIVVIVPVVVAAAAWVGTGVGLRRRPVAVSNLD